MLKYKRSIIQETTIRMYSIQKCNATKYIQNVRIYVVTYVRKWIA
jgi:hypothetical protein